MVPLLLPIVLSGFTIIAVLNGVDSIVNKKDQKSMSSFETLSTDVKTLIAESAAAKVASDALAAKVDAQTAEIAKLKAEAGTPDADVDALDALVKAALPVVPVPDPVVEVTPAE